MSGDEAREVREESSNGAQHVNNPQQGHVPSDDVHRNDTQLGEPQPDNTAELGNPQQDDDMKDNRDQQGDVQQDTQQSDTPHETAPIHESDTRDDDETQFDDTKGRRYSPDHDSQNDDTTQDKGTGDDKNPQRGDITEYGGHQQPQTPGKQHTQHQYTPQHQFTPQYQYTPRHQYTQQQLPLNTSRTAYASIPATPRRNIGRTAYANTPATTNIPTSVVFGPPIMLSSIEYENRDKYESHDMRVWTLAKNRRNIFSKVPGFIDTWAGVVDNHQSLLECYDKRPASKTDRKTEWRRKNILAKVPGFANTYAGIIDNSQSLVDAYYSMPGAKVNIIMSATPDDVQASVATLNWGILGPPPPPPGPRLSTPPPFDDTYQTVPIFNP
ncbi:hypothetical protein FBEOM_5887 [Fusarium beomiforme]|uniref:Uncharacterized protein n=1 Tax=Fusarium beomiforme TaxID=44412 RepID=A0A9P5AK22_9HYPO|nr:hypothetical protein FBEOM_5887 [Fusarium beomiforme]